MKANSGDTFNTLTSLFSEQIKNNDNVDGEMFMLCAAISGKDDPKPKMDYFSGSVASAFLIAHTLYRFLSTLRANAPEILDIISDLMKDGPLGDELSDEPDEH